MGKNSKVVIVIVLLLFSGGVYAQEEVQEGSLSPSELEAIRQLDKGTSSMLSKKYDEAIEFFEKARELNPELTEAYYNLGITYVELKKYKDSVKVLTRAIQLDPDHTNAYYALGYAYKELKK